MTSLAQIGLALRAALPLPLAGAALAYLAGAAAIGARLAAASSALALPLSTARATAIGLSAVFASHVSIGAAAGEAARLGWIARRTADRGRRGIAILAIDRVADGIAIAALVLVALAGHATTAPLVALAPLAIALVVLAFGARLVRTVPPRRLFAGVVAALPAAFVAWVLDLLRVFLAARAVGLSLDVHALAALALAALVGGQAPIPGGLGAVEGAMVAAGAALGLPTAPLVATVVVDRALTLALGTALGGLASARLYRDLRRTS